MNARQWDGDLPVTDQAAQIPFSLVLQAWPDDQFSAGRQPSGYHHRNVSVLLRGVKNYLKGLNQPHIYIPP